MTVTAARFESTGFAGAVFSDKAAKSTSPQARLSSGSAPLDVLSRATVDVAGRLGERAVANTVANQTGMNPANWIRRGGWLGAILAVLTPTNRTEPFTYQFAPDLRARQRIGETTITFEKQVGGTWQRLDVEARAGMRGMEVDLQGLRAAYGRPLPAGMVGTGEQARPIPEAARALDTNGDGRLQCREVGRWAPDSGYGGYSPNAQIYQDYISRHPGQHFVVPDAQRPRGVTAFDGCTDTPVGAHLTEAKADHGGILQARWGDQARAGILEQGVAQQRLARALGVTNDVQAQTSGDASTIRGIYLNSGVTTPVLHNPGPR